MNKLICAVYDKKAESYAPPVFQDNKGVAMRNFMDAVNDPNSALQKHPEDFSFHILGEYDPFEGKVIGYEEFQPICSALDVVKKEN